MDPHPVGTGREWEYTRPPVLVPEPARHARELSGRRVIVHDPQQGMWRYDLRAATAPHRYHGQMCVGVLPEADWYRRQRTPERAATPSPVPIELLWVEEHVDSLDASPQVPDQSDIALDAGRARRLVDDISRPPIRHLRLGTDEAALVGVRACVANPTGLLWDQRICGDPRREEFRETLNFTRETDSLGEPVFGAVVPVCSEFDWYAWQDRPTDSPEPVLHALRFVWLE